MFRVNATAVCVYGLRHMTDLDTSIDEVFAVVDKQTVMELYHIATSEAYSFLCVALTARDRDEMLFGYLDKRLIVQDA